MLPEELEDSSDLFYWNSCVKAIANDEMSIDNIDLRCQEQMLTDVKIYKATGEFPVED